jgi:hypothetical protein
MLFVGCAECLREQCAVYLNVMGGSLAFEMSAFQTGLTRVSAAALAANPPLTETVTVTYRDSLKRLSHEMGLAFDDMYS